MENFDKTKSFGENIDKNVSAFPVQQGGELVGSASNQSISSEGEGNNNSETAKGNGEKDTRFSIDEKASDLSKGLGIDIDTMERGVMIGISTL